MEDGKLYTTKHAFSCPDQLNAFKTLLENIVTKADEYISTDGMQTNNTSEGYHGIALSYRDKRIDLGSIHYQCKTNMSIPHKVSFLLMTDSSNNSYFMDVYINQYISYKLTMDHNV